MIRTLARLLVPLLLLSACADADLARYGALCRVEKAAEIPLLVERNFLVAPVNADGNDISLVVDTGAESSLLTPEAVQRLGFRLDPDHTSVLLGVAGSVRSRNVIVHTLYVGDAVATDRSVGVGTIGPFSSGGRPVAGLLGADFLAQYDVEIDPPNHRMALWDVSGCDGYVPWGGSAISMPASATPRGLIFVPVAIDGRPVRALLDTGARASLVTRRLAYSLGVDEAMLALDPRRVGQGVGNAGIDFRLHRFANVDVGSIPVRDMSLNVADMRLPGIEMLLGADWLSSRRIWISYSGRVVFVHSGAMPADG